jgi:flavin-binding protein dodecin
LRLKLRRRSMNEPPRCLEVASEASPIKNPETRKHANTDPRESKMSDPVYKVVEVVGTSEQSVSKAIDNAIAKASGTLRRLGWFEVMQIRGNVDGGKVNRYQVTLKVGFTLE